jgi:malonyl-ACP decarboxylase
VAELSLTDIRAYRESGAMAPPGAVCRPFDQNRAGFVPAQAAAAVLLDRDGPGMGAVLGVGQRLDARSGTTPHADGQVAAIRGALADARVDPAAIGYVNAHATGSAAGDPVEAAALCQVFGTSGSLRPWVNASKALLGHALTAAGLVELIATMAQLRLGFAHGNPNTVRPIPGVGGRLVGPRPQLLDGRLAVSNSFAFGGISASLVVSGDGR